MRNISFALTTQQFRDHTKTVTRRLGWTKLQPGDELMACEKCQGLKPGEKLQRLGVIRVLEVNREPLKDIRIYGQAECDREGFPDLNPDQFIEFLCSQDKKNITPETTVTRIRFEYL